MARFYNPYHFVPVEPKNEAQAWHSSKPGELKDHVTHDRYVAGTRSGRIVARLTTVTPTVIGGVQERKEDSSAAVVHPFELDGKPAIPGSTIRGLIGSLIEAASNGPLRILENSTYSYRKTMDSYLSAIGLIEERDGHLFLRPMCLPTLESTDGGRTFVARPKFRKIFPTPQFKVYFGNREQIRDVSFPYRTATSISEAVEMPVKKLQWAGNSVILDRSLHVKANRYAVAQDPDEREAGRLGMVRVLGCQGREMPYTKTHELWIPVPDPKAPLLPIATTALERFQQLADERTNSDPRHPFEPKGTHPERIGKTGKEAYLRLRTGDMVYFDVNDAGSEVTEVSFSSIWRDRVENRITHEAARTFAFFGAEHRPYQEGRAALSIAEQILGFVEEPAEGAPEKKNSLALASRLRFADAMLPDRVAGEFDERVTLKILDSPKLPCPSLYFRGRNGKDGWIQKRSLDPSQHMAQGRKWYLHGKVADNGKPWASRRPSDSAKQKNEVRPISVGQTFYFHIDFDNLSGIELGLLLYAMAPDERFHHKVGMGKPLGLGSVKVEVLGGFLADRQARYTLSGIRADRYSEAEFTAAGQDLLAREMWPTRYREEGRTPARGETLLTASREELDDSKLIPPAIRHALSLLGDYERAPAATDVHYPTMAEERDKEKDHYRWFVFNDGHVERGRGRSPSKQFLKPLGSERTVPPLTELE